MKRIGSLNEDERNLLIAIAKLEPSADPNDGRNILARQLSVAIGVPLDREGEISTSVVNDWAEDYLKFHKKFHHDPEWQVPAGSSDTHGWPALGQSVSDIREAMGILCEAHKTRRNAARAVSETNAATTAITAIVDKLAEQIVVLTEQVKDLVRAVESNTAVVEELATQPEKTASAENGRPEKIPFGDDRPLNAG